MDWGKLAVLNRKVRLEFLEKLTLKQRFEGGDGMSHTALWEWLSSGREESVKP